MVRAMSIEELERLIRRKYHISKLAKLVRVVIMDYLAIFEFSNGKIVLITFDKYDTKRELFVFKEKPLMVVGFT
jgi:hypothetical protein